MIGAVRAEVPISRDESLDRDAGHSCSLCNSGPLGVAADSHKTSTHPPARFLRARLDPHRLHSARRDRIEKIAAHRHRSSARHCLGADPDRGPDVPNERSTEPSRIGAMRRPSIAGQNAGVLHLIQSKPPLANAVSRTPSGAERRTSHCECYSELSCTSSCDRRWPAAGGATGGQRTTDAEDGARQMPRSREWRARKR